jgi:hypothetical protein
MADFRTLEDISNESQNDNNMGSMKPSKNLINFKAIIGLFIIFMFVINKVFIDNIIAKIGGTVDGRGLSALGTTVQGICMVIMYVVLVYLIDVEII